MWERYAEAYARYPHVLDLLRRISLPTDMFADCSGYPKTNDDAEASLRAELGGFAQLTRSDAQKKLVELEGRHTERLHQASASRFDSNVLVWVGWPLWRMIAWN